jgi:two-component system sensor kinase FixL
LIAGILAVAGLIVILLSLVYARRFREALQSEKKKIEAIIEHALDAVVVMDDEGRITAWNPQAESIFGWKEPEVLGFKMSERIIPPRYREAHEKGLQHFLSTGEGPFLNKRIELTALRRNGNEFPVELSVCPFRIGNQYIFSGFIRDITEHERAEEEFQRTLSLLRSTLESTADGILVVDDTGKMVSFNRRFAQMWRIPEPILESRDDNRALAFVLEQLKDPEGFLQKVRELYNQPEAESYDILEFKDGRIFERFSQPQRIGDKSVGRVWSFRDVTAWRQAEEALRHKSEELARSNKELEQFAYITSHDLAEPLHTIIGFADRLKKYCERVPDQAPHDYFDRIVKAALRMQKLIDDILVFSRVATRARPFEPVDLNTVIAEVVSDLEGRISETGARVEIGPLPQVRGDRQQLKQLLQNLVANAIKFRRKGIPPRVTIRSRPLDERFSEVTIEDNGIGFDEKFSEQIFKPFQRLHGWGEFEGSGVGLAICRKIVSRHQGEISARSLPGEGAVFTVRLPVDSHRKEAVHGSS